MESIRGWGARMLAAFAAAFSLAAHGEALNYGLVVGNPLAMPIPVAFTLSYTSQLSGVVSFSNTLGVLLMDTRGNGASLTPVGGFIVEALIGNTPVGHDTLGTVTSSFLPMQLFSGTYDCGAACGTVSLVFNFLLSPFDAAVLLGSFTLVPAAFDVPEPAPWMLLLVLACLWLALWWRQGRAPRT